MNKPWTFPVVATIIKDNVYLQRGLFFDQKCKLKHYPFVIIRMGNLFNANAVCNLLEQF